MEIELIKMFLSIVQTMVLMLECLNMFVLIYKFEKKIIFQLFVDVLLCFLMCKKMAIIAIIVQIQVNSMKSSQV